jgi:lysozyme
MADVARIQLKLFQDLPWIQQKPLVIQGVLANMAFNLGVNGLKEFHNTLALVQSGDYGKAADALKDSLWYTQVGNRAIRLVQQLRTQEWV